MFKHFIKYNKEYLIGLVLLVAINIVGAYIPLLIKQSIEALQDGASSLPQIVAIVVALALFMAVVRVVSRRVIFGVGRSIEYDFKKDLFNHLITFPPSFFTKQKTGDMISVLTNDVQSMRALGGFAMLNILNSIIAFSVITPVMFSLNAKLTCYLMVLIPCILVLVGLISNKLKTYQEIVLEKLGTMSNFIEQNLSGIHIIRAYAQEDAEINRFEKINNDLLQHYIKLIGTRSVIGPSMKIIASLGFVLLLWIGGQSVLSNDFSLGDFAAYALYIERLIWPIATLGWLVTVFYRAKISSKRINKILNEVPSIRDSKGSAAKSSFDQEILLSKLQARIPKGANVAIVGTIGSGKSILAKKLMHLIELEQGEILIDDIDIKNIKLQSLRSIINMVPQESFLFSTSIKENIAYAKDLSDEEVMNLAKLVNIHEEIMRFPAKYETVVGERGVTLSGGQRQRLAIARALSINPEILVLDDSLSSVDDATADKILHHVEQNRKDKTTIFITHKIKIVEDMDLILVMDKMKIVEQGRHDELLKLESGIYKSLWESQ